MNNLKIYDIKPLFTTKDYCIFAIIFFKTNGKASKEHLFMFLIGFMCFSVAVNWVPAEIAFSKDVKITFTTIIAEKDKIIRAKEKEAKAVRVELSSKAPAIDINDMIQY